MLAIVHARGEDIPRICEIASASFPDPWSEESFRSELEADGVFYAAFDGGRLDGYLVLRSMGPECEVLDGDRRGDARRSPAVCPGARRGEGLARGARRQRAGPEAL